MPKAQADIAQSIRDEALRTSALVTNLLDMARLQSRNVKINRDWQPLEEIIGVALQARAHQLSGHSVEVTLPADLPLLYFDPILMERVFCNLLENAAKYTPTGSTISLWARQNGDSVEIIVEDNGPGLPHGKEEALLKHSLVAGTNQRSPVLVWGCPLSGPLSKRTRVPSAPGIATRWNALCHPPAGGNAPEVPREVVE